MGAWDEELWKAAYAMIPQSTVVDSLNIGMRKIYADESITQRSRVDLLAQVHDSILMQIPQEIFEDKDVFQRLQHVVYEYVSPEMCYNNRKFRLNVDSKTGLNWGAYNADSNPDGMREIK
jgi:DNA polymerase I-like protein with 3'-5' exonuclease and polymerase domains